jgi:hypothetical protein
LRSHSGDSQRKSRARSGRRSRTLRGRVRSPHPAQSARIHETGTPPGWSCHAERQRSESQPSSARKQDSLPLNLEDIQGKQDDLADAGQAASGQPMRGQHLQQSEEGRGWKWPYDPAVADIIAFPFFSPNALVKLDLKFLLRKSLKYGWPPNWGKRG